MWWGYSVDLVTKIKEAPKTQISCDDKENAAKGQGKARETAQEKASGWNEKNLRTVSIKGYSIMMVTYLLVENSQISNILAYH